MRVSLIIDGDASGAEKALGKTSDALSDLNKRSADSSKAIEDGFNRAMGSADKLVDTTKAFGAANDNAVGSAASFVTQLDQVAQKALGSESALSKLSGGVAGVVRGLGSFGPSVGTMGLLTGALGIALTVASTFYGIIKNGGDTAETTLKEQARLVGVVKDAYSGAAKTAGDFLTQSKAVTQFQIQQNLISLRSQLGDAAKGITTDFSKRAQALSTPFYGLTGQRSTQLDDQAAQYKALQGAVDGLNASIAAGSPDIKKYQDQIAAIGTAAAKSNPDLAKAANDVLERSKGAADLTNKIDQQEAALAQLNGTATETQKKILGISTATSESANEFDRMLKSLQRQSAAQEAEANSVGLSAGAQAKLRAETLLNEAAQQAGISTAGKYAAAIDAVAGRFGAAAQKAAEARVKSDAAFQLSQLGRSSIEASVADQLRGAFGDNVNAQMNSATGNAVRFVEKMKELKGVTTDLVNGAWGTFRSQLMSGASAFGALKAAGLDAFGRIADKIASTSLDTFISKMFGLAGGNSSLLSLFGIGSSSALSSPLGVVGGAGSYVVPTFAAAGGGSFGPGWGIVGEEGPELIKVGSNRVDIFPNHVSAPFLPGFARGGGLTSAGSVSRLPAPQNSPIPLAIQVGVDMDENGNWKGYVKSVSQSAASSALSTYRGSEQFARDVGSASSKASFRGWS